MIARHVRPVWRISAATNMRSQLCPGGVVASSSRLTLDGMRDFPANRHGEASRSLHASSSSSAALYPTMQRAAGKGALAIEERELQREIARLRKKIVDADKVQDAEAAAAAYGDVTEDTLDLLYAAVSTPDPQSPEEKRLEERRRQRTQLRLQHRHQGLTKRLEALQQRLESMQQFASARPVLLAQSQDGEEDALVQITAAVKRLGEVRRQTMDRDGDEDGSDEVSTSLELGNFISAPNEAVTQKEDPQKFVTLGQEALKSIEAISARLNANGTPASSLPVPFVGSLDFKDIARSFAVASASSRTLLPLQLQLQSMSTLGHSSTRASALESALKELAERGDYEMAVEGMEIARSLDIEATQFASHCLIKAYTVAGHIEDADRLLQQLEETKPADMMTYSLVIRGFMLQRGDPAKQSRVYNIFARMRLQAHPNPDALLFAQMIHACALGIPQPNAHVWDPASRSREAGSVSFASRTQSSTCSRRRPDTERALDLFNEMTIRLGIQPTVEVYDAIILACARRRDTYGKALELLQSMIEIERQRAMNAEDESQPAAAFSPSVTTFNAVLEGCARNGDLFRARWILAEMLRGSSALWKSYEQRAALGIAEPWELQESMSKRPDAETLALVFYTYASYKLPPMQVKTQGVEAVAPDAPLPSSTVERRIESADDREAHVINLSRQMPQTRQSLLREVEGLMTRLLADRRDGNNNGLFSSITPHSKLVNGYLAAIAAHDRGESRLSKIANIAIEQTSEGEGASPSLLAQLDVPLSGHTCVGLLEATLLEGKRQQTDELVERIWQQWEPLEKAWRGAAASRDITAATVSRAWAALINNLAKSYHIQHALDRISEFTLNYPPSKTDILGKTHGSTAAPKAKPALTYRDLSLLHHRLKVLQASEPTQEGLKRIGRDIAKLTWTAHAYEAALRPRVPRAFRGEEEKASYATRRTKPKLLSGKQSDARLRARSLPTLHPFERDTRLETAV